MASRSASILELQLDCPYRRFPYCPTALSLQHVGIRIQTNIILNMSSKKDKALREQSEEKIKSQREAYYREVKEYKDRIRPLVDFLRSKQLKFNHAQVGNERIEYFRLDEFDKIVESHKDYINSHEKLNVLVKNCTQEFIYFRRPDSIKIKYPKTLEPVLNNHGDRKYASFRFDTTESKKGMTILLILGVLALVMFPIWPYELKYGIWLVSLVLLVIMLGIIFIRLSVYLLCVLFNYHIWIFPNLLSSTGFADSFIPILEIAKGDKSWFNLFIRLFAFSSFLLLVMHVYLNPNFLEENIEFTKETIEDMHDWGVAKLKNEGNFSQRALTNLDVILNETADVAHHEDDPIGEEIKAESEEVETQADYSQTQEGQADEGEKIGGEELPNESEM